MAKSPCYKGPVFGGNVCTSGLQPVAKPPGREVGQPVVSKPIWSDDERVQGRLHESASPRTCDSSSVQHENLAKVLRYLVARWLLDLDSVGGVVRQLLRATRLFIELLVSRDRAYQILLGHGSFLVSFHS